MKKYYILVVIAIIVVAVNFIFWQWASLDNANDGAAVEPLKEWAVFQDADFVQFKAPNNFERQASPSGGAYWFDPIENDVSLVYEKFTRDESISAAAQVKDNVAASAACYQLSSVGEFSLFRDCEYLDSVYTFVFLSEGEQLAVISINHKHFSGEEVNYIINSIRSER